MLELVQGEGGINIADVDYVKAARKLCDKKGLVLIFDEVQTCMGRTGKWFGHLNYGVTPDIMTMAKALGGGAAIGGIEASPKVAAALTPGQPRVDVRRQFARRGGGACDVSRRSRRRNSSTTP